MARKAKELPKKNFNLRPFECEKMEESGKPSAAPQPVAREGFNCTLFPPNFQLPGTGRVAIGVSRLSYQDK
uniref:Uncharacterized protein LOC8275459 isoform X2 n=1 Tax=Rhizophora mucronata TaxID=61149 RepID=A0A2P2PJZ5_RHIMU